MAKLYNNIAILGLGLIGGSIALDLKKRRLAKRVVGYNRSAPSRRAALKRRACDAVISDPVAAVRDADLVVLATPVRHIPELLRKIAPGLKKGAVVTDVGSTKENIVRRAKKLLPKGVIFVGGHPIAGTEKTGMASALEGLFEGRWWVFTPDSAAGKRAAKRLRRLAKALGAKSLAMSPKEHDEILAAISHLPHMLAYALVHAAMGLQKGKALKLSGSSFRDVTRIAASSAQMWTDIGLDNHRGILRMIDRHEQFLKKLKSLLAKRDAKGLEKFFESAARVRRKL
ncbi:MAG: prephenate dehydrogenase/arogenate dehydrogenase family protein [Deltaproteobacteria bacterium]|nr:prephenate dehydrogenase/arogenate dehydrogenase family protein [Deltaproteobacteria bacterium]